MKDSWEDEDDVRSLWLRCSSVCVCCAQVKDSWDISDEEDDSQGGPDERVEDCHSESSGLFGCCLMALLILIFLRFT